MKVEFSKIHTVFYDSIIFLQTSQKKLYRIFVSKSNPLGNKN